MHEAILYGVPRVAYNTVSCTPFPMCIVSCAAYLGIPMSYQKAVCECGAAFRFAWNTAEWDGGNVDAILTFDDPLKVYACGFRTMGREMRFVGRSKKTKKQEFTDFIRPEIDKGNPVIALGVIGPPEAGVVTGYRNDGETLMGWNVFQNFPEYQSGIKFLENGYYITSHWWENHDTKAVFAAGETPVPGFTPGEVLRNACDALNGRMHGTYAKGLMAYDAWKDALLDDRAFSPDILLPMLTERMMCHGDAMDCLSDGRGYAAAYLRELAAAQPAQAETLCAAADAFEQVRRIIWQEMVPVLGSWERSEREMRALARPETRRLFAGLIGRMKAQDARGLELLRAAADHMA